MKKGRIEEKNQRNKKVNSRNKNASKLKIKMEEQHLLNYENNLKYVEGRKSTSTVSGLIQEGGKHITKAY